MRQTALRRAARSLYRLLAAIGLLTVLVISTPLVSWWARAYSGPIQRPNGDILILLSAANDDRGGLSYSSFWRARQAIYAWQTGGFQKIVISGGAGPGILNYLVAEGIPRDAILAEWNSTSTRQSGLALAQLLSSMPGRKVLLTSDFHIYRALRVFRKLQVDVTPMPAPDALQLADHWNSRFSVFETLLTETWKIVYYGLRGWI
jgi:uncharacterized SAM-binding protein YcdF (DUF218 family)